MKKTLAMVLMICLLVTLSASAENATATLQDLYAQAELAMATGDYAGAAAKFEALGAYSDASQMAMYCKAVTAAETLGMYDVAVSAFTGLGDFKDSGQMAIYYTARGYQAAGDAIDITAASDNDLYTAEEYYDKAAESYTRLALFKDCLTRLSQCQTQSKEVLAEREARSTAKKEAAYQAAVKLEESEKYEEAIEEFNTISGYKDSQAHINACQKAIMEKTYEAKYQEALTLEESGDYYSAYNAFKEISEYRDVAYRMDHDQKLKYIETLRNIGNIITLGNYEQDNSSQNGKEPLEWIVLDEDNGNILLISRYGLETKAFHDVKLTIVSWADCSLRKYLNDVFLNTALNSEEQTAIVPVNIDNSSNQWYKEWTKDYSNWETQCEGGKETEDRVFLLSYAEANKYFDVTPDNKNNTKGRLVLTPYAIAQGAANEITDNEITGLWWLRSPGKDSPYRAAVVRYDGSLYFGDKDNDYTVIRPVIWVNLNSLIDVLYVSE